MPNDNGRARRTVLGGSEAAPTPRPSKMSELIARELVDYVIDHKLPEGARLPNETELIAQFGVGRTTLREALRLLESRGVITIRSGPGGGPVVRRPTPADFGDALNFILQFEHASFEDLVSARRIIEPAVARLAAIRASDEEIEQLVASVEAIRQNPGDMVFLRQENGRFHALLAQAAGNIALRFFVDAARTSSDYAAAKMLYGPRRHKTLMTGHRAIVDAVVAHDPDAAEEAMRAHLDEVVRYMRRVYSHLLTRPVRWVS